MKSQNMSGSANTTDSLMNVQKKRKLDGSYVTPSMMDVDMTLPPRKTYDHVTDKELRKKLKNRESAQAARDRKKIKMIQLENQVASLLDRNRILEMENRDLRVRLHSVGKGNSMWQNRGLNQSNHPIIVRDCYKPTQTTTLGYSTQPNHQQYYQQQYQTNSNKSCGLNNLPTSNEHGSNYTHSTNFKAADGKPQDYKQVPYDSNPIKTNFETVVPKQEVEQSSFVSTDMASTTNEMCAEQWLMLSFKPDPALPTVEDPLSQFSDLQQQAMAKMSAESDLDWGDIDLETTKIGSDKSSPSHFDSKSLSPDFPPSSCGEIQTPYEHDVYYDSSGMDNISSPDTTYSFASETSPTIAAGSMSSNLHNNALQVT